VGDKVLVLIPTAESKFLATWHGSYEVIEMLEPVNYRARQPGRRKPTYLPHEPIEAVAQEDSLGRVMVKTQDANITSGGSIRTRPGK
jgi:hypothetical protein